MNAAINKILLVLCLFGAGFVVLCMGAMSVLGQMNEDLNASRTTQYTPLGVSNDPFVRNIGGYYVDYKDGYP